MANVSESCLGRSFELLVLRVARRFNSMELCRAAKVAGRRGCGGVGCWGGGGSDNPDEQSSVLT